ncbi:hypothetical protein BS47DRAFT_507379 [Hydnum rufescens UP504]|uniref:Uncharacterized protein n=1 Tax=Hydnum rufescens UP504 TaxID=1448309 RepID=A0A9P6B591_9AGAM|nr:hypothetical protein BS47DRAFT_507379 [Hydnum rufescens UP504]
MSTSSRRPLVNTKRGIRPVPNSAQRSRFIIRTRSQTARAPSRDPLRDALTNSPTKQAVSGVQGFVMNMDDASLLIGRKRAPSPSFEAEAGGTAKKHKPAQSPMKPILAPGSPVKHQFLRPSAISMTRRIETPRGAGAPPAPSQGSSESHLSTPAFHSPATITSLPMIDIFNPPKSVSRAKTPSPSKGLQYQLNSRPSPEKKRAFSGAGLKEKVIRYPHHVLASRRYNYTRNLRY